MILDLDNFSISKFISKQEGTGKALEFIIETQKSSETEIKRQQDEFDRMWNKAIMFDTSPSGKRI